MQVEQIKPEFGARISALDFKEPREDDIRGVKSAMDRYGVSVFPRANLFDQEELARFARRFGPIHRSLGMIMRAPQSANVSKELSDTSNVPHEKGSLRTVDPKRWANNLQARRWHTDGSYQERPGKYSMLSASVVTSVGGETEFADMRGAYDALPTPMKETIEDLVAEHSFAHARMQVGVEMTEDEKAVQKPVHHRIVRTDPKTGRKSLYIGTPASHIVGWSIPESKDLLHELLDHATRPEFVYRHKWSVGDLVMWDNSVTLHRARRHYPETAPRDMRRATVADTEDAPALLD